MPFNRGNDLMNLCLGQRQVKEEGSFYFPVERQPFLKGSGRSGTVRKGKTYQLINHSARYSKATNMPITAQYIAHFWRSGSEKGRRDKALKVP